VPRNYQVIARKYRPQTLNRVVGQEAIITTLKNALHSGRLAHAYLFCGCRGTGKTTLARIFAKALNCSHLTEDFEPCNACPSCLDIIAGRSLDVLEIDGASNRGIDDVRQINETVGYAPASGKYKIYLIDEVHMLTKEAFNALLKTLEEPPAHVKFFFATTEPHKVLPTIISRCQRFDLNRISLETIKSKLAWIASDLGATCEEEALTIIAHLSEGSLRDAESLLDQIICYAESPITAAQVSASLGMVPQSVFASLDRACDEHNLSYAFELASDLFSSGKDVSHFIDSLIEHYRSLLKLKLGAAASQPKEHPSAFLYTEEHCLYILDFLIHWQQQIGKTPFKRVNLEMILLHIIRSKHRVTLPSLIKRLHELDQKSPSEARPAHFPPFLSKEKPEAIATVLPEPTQVQERACAQELPEDKAAHSPPFLSKEKPEAIATVLPEPTQVQERACTQELPEDKAAHSSLLLSKEKWEAIASDQQVNTTVLPEPTQVQELLEAKVAPSEPTIGVNAQSRYDTLMRFAAVELEGTIKKEQSNG
jgi:DNA polymerase III subunit gamma/tau